MYISISGALHRGQDSATAGPFSSRVWALAPARIAHRAVSTEVDHAGLVRSPGALDRADGSLGAATAGQSPPAWVESRPAKRVIVTTSSCRTRNGRAISCVTWAVISGRFYGEMKLMHRVTDAALIPGAVGRRLLHYAHVGRGPDVNVSIRLHPDLGLNCPYKQNAILPMRKFLLSSAVMLHVSRP